MQDQGGPAGDRRPPRVAGVLLFGMGAALLGLAEGTLELWAAGTEPSFARAPAILAFAMGTWSAPALACLVAAALLGGILRALRVPRRSWFSLATAAGLYAGLVVWQAGGGLGVGLLIAVLVALLAEPVLARLLSRRARAWSLVTGLLLVLLLCFFGVSWELERRAPRVPQGRAVGARPNVVVLVADALRADALSCLGGATPTPNIDAIADGGWNVPDAISTSSWTLPAVTSLWSSRSPRRHGVTTYSSVLDEEPPLLAEALGAAGYVTAAVVANPLVDPARGFGRGLDLFRGDTHQVEQGFFWVLRLHRWLRSQGWVTGPNAGRKFPLPTLSLHHGFRVRRTGYMDAEEVTRAAVDLLDEIGDQGFFLYLHYLDPHDPYLQHPAGLAFREPGFEPANLADLRAAYAGEVAFLDRHVGALRAALEERGLWSNTLLVFTADHGEEFLDHGGWQHGESLYDELVRVPFLVHFPDGFAVPPTPPEASLLDLAPTLMEVLDLPDLPGAEGVSLLAGGARGHRYADRTSDRNWLAALRTDQRHWIVRVPDLAQGGDAAPPEEQQIRAAFDARAVLQGHDRSADPAQRDDRAPAEPEAAAEAMSLLRSYLLRTRATPGRSLSAEEEARLRAMGYLK